MKTNRLKKIVLWGAVLGMTIFATLPTMAQSVIMSGNYYLVHNDAGTSVSTTATDEFNPSTCIWYINNRTIRPADVNGTAINVNNNYLRTGGITLGASQQWTTAQNGSTLRANNQNYLRLNGTTWQLSNTNNSRATPRAVEIGTPQPAQLTDITINSGVGSISTTGNYTYGHSNATYTPAYTNYRFGNPVADHYIGSDNSTLDNINPTPVNSGYTWTLSNNTSGYATMVGNELRVTALPTYDIEITLTCSLTHEGLTKSDSKTILLMGTTVAQPSLTRSGNIITLQTATSGATIYYTTDGTTPTSASTAYSGPINIASLTFPVTINAIAIRNGNSSEQASATYSQPSCEKPVITVSNTGVVTITCATDGATIRYTYGNNPADPTGSSPAFTTLTLSQGQFIKAIATKSSYDNSAVASAEYVATGVSGNMVVLDDREDHTWTYYSAKPDTDYPDVLNSPDPRNVKITYYANGYRHDGTNFTAVTGVQLSHNETANTFVYYETLEKTPGGQILTGNYPYKVIPNPFSKRPKNGDTYYGFEGWRIKSGGDKIANHNNNDILGLEEVINFVGLDAGYTPNVISAEIELEAIWAPATVVTNSSANLTDTYSYERNFIVCNADISISNLAQNATVSSRYPDGTAYGNANTDVTGITVNNTSGDIKVEYIGVSGTFNGPNNKWLIVGRGCEGAISSTVCNQANAKFRLESGTHAFVHPHPSTTGIMVFGSDYDRATVDNSKLRVVDYVTANSNGGRADGNTDEYMDITIKSGYYGYKSEYDPTDTYGNYGLGVGGNTDGITSYTPNGSSTTYNYNNGPSNKLMSFYCGGTHGGGTGGIIRVLIEGGELSSLNGGGTKNAAADNGVIMHHIRMKGGWVKGALYGTASATNSTGSARLVITGGEVNGWVAGACNGTRSDGNYNGELNGNCYIYVGGNAELRSHNNDGVYNNAWGLVFNVEGGTVFGAGKGIDNNQNHVGSANNTYISVSDNAYIEQAVYGGAFHGISKESRIYLTGSARVGNVYGGSFEPVHPDNEATWRCNNTDIRMYGGNVTGGIYGGHNAKGTVYQTTSLLINGGQVGVDADHTANIHGGGYGDVTSVSGNVTVTLGDSPANSGGVTVYGNVYGGSALGDVNTNSNNNTIVTLNKGTINGNLFGGALGVGADVNGKITVTMNGGTVNGNLFGGGDAAAYSPNANFPIVNVTGGTVTNIFGGGNGDPNDATQETAKVTGNPQVTLSGNATVTGNVYGGGNAAKVEGNTSVILKD